MNGEPLHRPAVLRLLPPPLPLAVPPGPVEPGDDEPVDPVAYICTTAVRSPASSYELLSPLEVN